MGTFAELYSEKESVLQDCKKKEFIDRIETIFQLGGMMEVERIQLYGIKVRVLRKAKMEEKGMEFFYNYFEDDYWEHAGFDKEKCCVWSNKIGWNCFHKTVVAAYVLEELYTDGVAVAMVNGMPVRSWGYVGWINYLFDETYHLKNFDPWKLFESIHYSDREYLKEAERFDFGDTRYAFIGNCEIYAVLNGTEDALEKFDSENNGELEKEIISALKCLRDAVNIFIKMSDIDKESQMQLLMENICRYYENDTEKIEKIEEDIVRILLMGLDLSDAPAFAVKLIAEVYDKDFWELWAKIQDVAKRKRRENYGNDYYYVTPMSTVDFFRQSPDDMIPYWKEDADFEFSKDLWEWFAELKDRYVHILNSNFSIENPLLYILNVMKEVDENYYQIYTFAEFFEETLAHLQDRKYLSFWKLYEELICDPELKEAGDVIFVPEGPEYEEMGLHYWGEQPKRRLLNTWDIMDLRKRNNKARVTFRRYMALVANKKLRYKVFRV